MTSLNALQALAVLQGNMLIAFNEQLPACDAEAFARRLEAAGWDGAANIQNNLNGACD